MPFGRSSLDLSSVFVSTGELSGDMHAAHLIRSLQQLRLAQGHEAMRVTANGSSHLAAAGATLLHDVATWSEIGIVRTFLKAPMFLKALRTTIAFILKQQPAVVVLVDSRVMNLRLAKALRLAGYKGRIVYYVAPVRWESLYDEREKNRSLKNSRFLDLKRFCNLAIPIYPVSLDVYEQLQIPYLFAGHPLCELARPRLSDSQFNHLTGFHYDPERPPMIIGAMVGSRLGEVKDIAPQVFAALRLIQDALRNEAHLPQLQFVATAAHSSLRGPIMAAARQAGLNGLELLDAGLSYDVMARARLMIVKSGTSLHECMLIGVPAIMCYRVAPAVAWIARHLMHFSMPFYGFPNLLAGQAIVPELIQEDCRHTLIAEQAGELLFDESQREVMLAEFEKLRSAVCRPNVLSTLSEAIQHQLDLAAALQSSDA